MTEIVYLVAIAHVWARGSIFRSLREYPPLAPLLDCPLCSGVQIGLLGHATYLVAPSVITWLGIGSVVGTASLALYGAIRRI